MTNTIGHGHIIPRDDGYKAKCGGPACCGVCMAEWNSIEGKEYRLKMEQPKIYRQWELDAAVLAERERCLEWLQQQQAPLSVAQLQAGDLLQKAITGIHDGADPLA